MTEIARLSEAEPLLEGLEAAVFDLDDTLYPEKDYVRGGFAAVAALFPEAEDMEARLWAAFEAGKPAVDTALAAVGRQSRKAEALAAYRTHTPVLRLYPGAEAMLRRLRGKMKLAVLTDGRPEGQRAKIAALGLEELFDEILITDELGGPEYRKPCPAGFERLAEELGTELSRMAYVGDNIDKDFIAPEALGMGCIWFRNPEGLYFRKHGKGEGEKT